MAPLQSEADQAEQLWVGDGQTLYLSSEDLMFEWTTGFATRSKNLDSLCLDKIVYMMMVQRSRPVILFGAAVLAIAVPIVLGWTTLGDGCARLSTSCPKDTQEDADTFDAIVVAISWAIALVLVVVYICTMTTTLIFGTSPSTGMSTDGTVHIHLTGPEAENDGDRIIRQIHQRRGEVMRSYR